MSAESIERSGSAAAAHRRVWEPHLPLVRRLATSMLHRVAPYLELDDLIAVGVEALLRAAERYDPGRGTSFLSFAYLRVRGAMRESVGVFGPLPRGMIRRRHMRTQRRDAPRVIQLDEEQPFMSRCLADELARAIDAARPGDTPRSGH